VLAVDETGFLRKRARCPPRWPGSDAAGGLDAVDSGHADVNEHDVGAFPLGEAERFVAVARLADDRNVIFGVNQCGKAGSHQRLIIGEHHPDHAGAPFREDPRSHAEPASGGGASFKGATQGVCLLGHPVMPFPGTLARLAFLPSASTWTTSAASPCPVNCRHSHDMRRHPPGAHTDP
jgi:hypothetical protein